MTWTDEIVSGDHDAVQIALPPTFLLKHSTMRLIFCFLGLTLSLACHAENFVVFATEVDEPMPLLNAAIDLDSVEHVGNRVTYRVRWYDPYTDKHEGGTNVVICDWEDNGVWLSVGYPASSTLLSMQNFADDTFCEGNPLPNLKPVAEVPVVPQMVFSAGPKTSAVKIAALFDKAMNGDGYARNDLRHAAQLGNVEAQLAMGRLYWKRPRRTDFYEASKWYRLAFPLVEQRAQQGDAASQFELSKLLLYGIATERDPARAIEWLQKAADLGYAPALADLGIQYGPTPWIGTRHLPPDNERAFSLFTRAAVLGDSSAMYSLGRSYIEGVGVPKDDEAGKLWYEKAAEAGDLSAQAMLGQQYLQGREVMKNYALAAKWLKLAAQQGDDQSAYDLAKLYAMGQGVTQSYAEAFSWMRKITNPDLSAVALAWMYREGKGVEKNPSEASRWQAKADRPIKVLRAITPRTVTTPAGEQRLVRWEVVKPRTTAKPTAAPTSKSAPQADPASPSLPSH